MQWLACSDLRYFVFSAEIFQLYMELHSLNSDLACRHRLKRALVALWSHARAAGCIHDNGDFRKKRFDQHCVGNHADIRAQLSLIHI